MPIHRIENLNKGIEQLTVDLSRGKAPFDVLNLDFDNLGRPKPRKGYVLDTSTVLGSGDQIVKLHRLADKSNPAISRLQRFQEDQNYVVVGSRVFLADPDKANSWYDLDRDTPVPYAWQSEEAENELLITSNATPIHDARGYPIKIQAYDLDNPDSSSYRFSITAIGLFYTYKNTKYGIETYPSDITLAHVYSRNPEATDSDPRKLNLDEIQFIVDINTDDAPPWADEVVYYITEPLFSAVALMRISGTQGAILYEVLDYPLEPNDDGFGFRHNPNGDARLIENMAGETHISVSELYNVGLTANRIIGSRSPLNSINPQSQITFNVEIDYQDISNTDKATWMVVPKIATATFDRPFRSADTAGLYPITLHAGRIWGWDKEENLIRFSLVNNYDVFPNSENELPHSFTIEGSEGSPVVAMKPIPGKGGIYVFYRDEIRTIKGQSIVSGLYTLEVPQTDLDASGNVNTGTSSPRSIVTFKNTTLFLGSDRVLWSVTEELRLTNIGKNIQKTLDSIEDLSKVVSFGYLNRYHIIIDDNIYVWDLNRKFWTRYDWNFLDAHWSTGGENSESILYAINDKGTVFRLYESDSDVANEEGIPWLVETAQFKFPDFANIVGVYVHVDNPENDIPVQVDIIGYTGEVVATNTFTPKEYNLYNVGFFVRQTRASVRISGVGQVPEISGISIEYN